jgi:hypothetical protein
MLKHFASANLGLFYSGRQKFCERPPKTKLFFKNANISGHRRDIEVLLTVLNVPCSSFAEKAIS